MFGSTQSKHVFARPCGRIPPRDCRSRYTQSPAYIGECSPAAAETVAAIREAVAHSTCAPYADLASDNTMIINPPWAEEPRTTGISQAACGVTTSTKYAEEHVRPLAAAYETDGSVFLLWERRAQYTQDGGNGESAARTEDICGVTYVKKASDGKATVIATFRQPTPDELRACFREDREVSPRPGADNFFEGRRVAVGSSPIAQAQMVAAVRTFYDSWRSYGGAGDGSATRQQLETMLSHFGDPRMRVHDPVWETQGQYLPVNRVEAAMWMERAVKASKGALQYELKAVAPAEGTNLVFALWFAKGLTGPDGGDLAGVHIFAFGDDLKIKSLTSFREPDETESRANLQRRA